MTHTLFPTQSEQLDIGSDSDEPPTCAGKDGECSRTVDQPGDRCWQHAED